jgi:hypothetical protein
MAITEKTRKVIWARSGNRCSICRTELVLQKDQYNIHLNLGEECHIISKQQNGPRYQIDPNLDYDGVDNLLLLCCNDHKTIDEQVKKFTVNELRRIKSQHEIWVKKNLDGNYSIAEPSDASRLEELIDFVTGKHDIEMNTKSSRLILESHEGLQLAFAETEKIKEMIYDIVAQLKAKASSYNVQIQDNQNHICDLRFKGHTLLAQFYQAYSNSAEKSYLLFAVVNGLFDSNGYADPFYPATVLEITRLNFSFNDKGQFGWRDQERPDDFYLSTDITELWIAKYFKTVLNK